MKRKGNLSEELYNMRKLMNFNSEKFRSETTSLDRLVEEKMMEKYLLNEQVSQTIEKDLNGKSKKTIELVIEQDVNQSDGKYGDVLYSGDDYWSRYAEERKALYKINNNPLYKDIDESIHNKLVRKWSNELTAIGNYPLFLEGMKKHHTNNAKYWFEQLTQDSRISFLTYFNEWFNNQKPRIQKKILKEKVDLDIKIIRGKPGTTELPGEAGGETIEPLKLPLNPIAGKDTYKDNEFALGTTLNAEIDRWAKELQMVIDQLKEDNPNRELQVKCTHLEIASSCSRLRNTMEPPITWLELSKKRAELVQQNMISKLQGIGVVIPSDILVVLKGGTNDDGTSGPDPSNNFKFDSGKSVTNMRYSDDGKTPLSGADSKRQLNGYPNLLSSQAESHKYKFCAAWAEFEVTSPGGEEPPKPGLITNRGYTIEIKWVGEIPGGKIRLGKFNTSNFKTTLAKATGITDVCNTFKGGETYGIK
jgi:hypothetical protein